MRVCFVYHNAHQHTGYGAGYVASAVLQAGHELDFFDTYYDPLGDIVRRVEQMDYGVIMLSASTLFYPEACELAHWIKRIKPNVPVVLGGIHATIVKRKILQECPSIDYICVGEGEGFAVDFVDTYPRGDVTALRNIGYRLDGSVRINRVRPCVGLDGLPRFRYDLWQPKSVTQPSPLPGMTYVRATRGCPYRCSYCGNSVYLDMYLGQYLRQRNISQVIANLQYLKERYPVGVFYFSDEMMLYDKAYVAELLGRLHKEVGLPYGCMARVEHIDNDIVQLFQKSKCQYVGMGVECGDEQFRRDWLNRRMTNQQIIDAFTSLRAVKGICLHAYNMRGYPVPYDNELWESTKRLNRQCKPDHSKVATFYPFPGTKLGDYCIKHDLIDQTKAQQTRNTHSKSVLRWDRVRNLPAGATI